MSMVPAGRVLFDGIDLTPYVEAQAEGVRRLVELTTPHDDLAPLIANLQRWYDERRD